MERAESQGHRLSSYASSSSAKHSPKTPKKSIEKLSTHSNSIKDESLSPHHLISGYSYTSINSQSKEQQHQECLLRCTCNNFTYNSLKSGKSNSGSNTGDKFTKLTKSRCDAATSPGRLSQKSPQTSARWVEQKNTTGATSNELRVSDDKKITNKPSPSPRRLIATRNAATSPGLDIRKLGPKQYFEALPKNPDISVKTVLEKSNSLGESKPNRQLRTTRSLSPRPPVRHQHAIMVSDENDVVSVKVSPNDDFEVDMESKNTAEQVSASYKTLPKHKAQSEQTSPNLGDFDASFSYEKMSNRSTGCLVYVPSDPWLKMSDLEALGDNKKKSGDLRKKFAKLSDETRSLSRGNIPLDNNDPWIWRKSSNDNSSPIKNMKRSSKQELYRQTKSFSATKFEISNSKQTISLALNDNDNPMKSSTGNRPKLQRCKSPIVIDDDFGSPSVQTPKDLKKSCTCNNSSTTSIDASGSQQNLSSSRKDLNLTVDKTQNNLTIQQNKAFLHVINPNLVQSRHSFSSVPESKDDELQLNIRRLSEQIKNTPNNNNTTNQSSPGADFTDYLNQFKLNEAKKSKTKNSMKNNTDDPVLETTC